MNNKCSQCGMESNDLRRLEITATMAELKPLPQPSKFCNNCWESLFNDFYQNNRNDIRDYFNRSFIPRNNEGLAKLLENYEQEFFQRYNEDENG